MLPERCTQYQICRRVHWSISQSHSRWWQRKYPYYRVFTRCTCCRFCCQSKQRFQSTTNYRYVCPLHSLKMASTIFFHHTQTPAESFLGANNKSVLKKKSLFYFSFGSGIAIVYNSCATRQARSNRCRIRRRLSFERICTRTG